MLRDTLYAAQNGNGPSLTAIYLWSWFRHRSNGKTWTGRIKLSDDQESSARATVKSLMYAGERGICCLMVIETDLKKDSVLSRITSPKENWARVQIKDHFLDQLELPRFSGRSGARQHRNFSLDIDDHLSLREFLLKACDASVRFRKLAYQGWIRSRFSSPLRVSSVGISDPSYEPRLIRLRPPRTPASLFIHELSPATPPAICIAKAMGFTLNYGQESFLPFWVRRGAARVESLIFAHTT